MSISPASSSVSKYIASPRASPRASSGGRARSARPAAKPSIVRSLPGRELHHEQLGLVVAEQLEQVLEAQRLRDARAGSSAAARAGRPRRRGCGSRASPTRRPASARRPRPGSRAPARRPRPRRRPARAATPDRARRSRRASRSCPPCRSSAGSPPARRPCTATPRRDPSPRPARAGRRTTAAAPRPRPPARRSQPPRDANEGSDPAGTTWKESHRCRPIACVGHVGADEPHLALAVLPQRTEESGRPGRPRGGDHERERPHDRSMLSARSCCTRRLALGVQHRQHGLAHRVARVHPDLRMREELEPLERGRAARSSCGQPLRQCWFESER